MAYYKGFLGIRKRILKNKSKFLDLFFCGDIVFFVPR